MTVSRGEVNTARVTASPKRADGARHRARRDQHAPARPRCRRAPAPPRHRNRSADPPRRRRASAEGTCGRGRRRPGLWTSASGSEPPALDLVGGGANARRELARGGEDVVELVARAARRARGRSTSDRRIRRRAAASSDVPLESHSRRSVRAKSMPARAMLRPGRPSRLDGRSASAAGARGASAGGAPPPT